jgi:hypothetical protein
VEIEELKEMVYKELKKEHKIEVDVTRAVTCMEMQMMESYALVVGRQRHETVQKMFMPGMYPEVSIALVYDDVLIKGRVDLLDLKNYMIWEIKPMNMKPEYYRQLSLYVVMLRKLTGVNFWGGFIFYSKDRAYQEYSIALDMTILDTVVQNIKAGKTRISGAYCELCKLERKCDKPYRWSKGLDVHVIDEIKLI